jgi:DinB superfamily
MTELEKLRYPVGRFTPPTGNLREDREACIDTLRHAPDRLRAAVLGLTDAQLDTPYREGGWTIRQVVHHLADSHAYAYLRAKHALTEDWPTIKAYNESDWAKLGDSRTLPVDFSLAMVSAVHGRLVGLFQTLADADFDRGFVHPERGKVTLATNLAIYAWHSRHHTAHITSLRARQGW